MMSLSRHRFRQRRGEEGRGNVQGLDGKRMSSLRDWGLRDIKEKWLEMEGTLGGQGEDQAGKTAHG